MSRSHDSVRNALRKCIPCNAPLVETTDGTYVCVECGECRIEPSRAQRVTVEQSGVTVTKSTIRDTDTARITYTAESTRSVPITVRITDDSRATGADAAAAGDTTDGVVVDTQLAPGGETRVVRQQRSERACEPTTRGDVSIEVASPTSRTATGDTADVEATASDPDAGIELRDGGGRPPADTRSAPRAWTTDARHVNGASVHSRIRDEFDESTLEVLAALPAYNEAETIASVVEEVSEYADGVVVVDDGSEDATAERADGAGALVLEHPSNRGYGTALQTIFEEASRVDLDHLVVLDGDGQHDPSDIPLLVGEQRATGAEIVIGSRFEGCSQPGLPWYRRIGLWVVNGFFNLSMGVVRAESRIGDTQSGFRAYTPTAVRSLASDDTISDRMGASTDILHHAHQHDYDIAEVGTTIDYDVADANNHNPVHHGFHLVRNMLRTVERERPMLALGLPGLLLTIGGLAFGNLAVHRTLVNGQLPLQLGVSAVVLTVAGIFAGFTAIILHSMNTYHPQ